MKPILNRVTITGADDSIDPKDLKRLQEEFPFVEWGILVSESRTFPKGTSRFPSPEWLRELCGNSNKPHGKELGPSANLRLSVHLCGRWVRQIFRGAWSWMCAEETDPVGHLIAMARRVQLNFSGAPPIYGTLVSEFDSCLPGKQVILQVEDDYDHIVSNLYDEGGSVAALYDSSGGAGKLPSTWPVPLIGIPCGYAGGLSAENVEEQLELLSTFVKDLIWIDTETRVRSDDDQQFDLDLVRAFLEKTAPWVVKQGTTDAVKILHDLYVGDDPARQASLEEERRIADEEQRRYDAGELTDDDF